MSLLDLSCNVFLFYFHNDYGYEYLQLFVVGDANNTLTLSQETPNVDKVAVSKAGSYAVKVFAFATIIGSILLWINPFDALFGQSEIQLIPTILTYCLFSW
ncbi:MAG: hypothetical protein ACJAXJ_001707 [Colwellia sp.]